MSTIAVGASQTFNLGDGQNLEIATNGGFYSISLTPNLTGKTTTSVQGPGAHAHTFGPYAGGATIILGNQTVDTLTYVAPPSNGGGGTWGSITGTLASQSDLQAALDAKEGILAPMSLAAATTLSAATHGNRQIVYSGASATLAISNDATGGWANDAQVIVQTAAGSAGVPTLTTPDGKTITGSVTQPIGATRKGANSWDVFLLPQSASSGSALSTVSPGSLNGVATANMTASAIVGFGLGTIATLGTVQFRAVGTTAYQQMNRDGYTGTSAVNTNTNVHTPLIFALGAHRQRLVVMGAPYCTMGNTACFFLGLSSALAAFTTTTLNPADGSLGALIGIGWSSAGTQSNLQLVTAPSSGTGTYQDLGASFPVPTTIESVMYRLQLDYYPSTDAGGRRVVWTLTEMISGATATGTITSNLIAQATAQLYSAGVASYTVSNAGAPGIDFSGIYMGAFTQWAP